MTRPEDIYSDQLLALVAAMPRTERLAQPQATAKAHSKLCGSTVEVDLVMEGDVVTDYGQTVRACLLGQTAAAIMGREIVGSTADELREVDCGILEGRRIDPHSPNAGWRVVLQWMQHDNHDARFEADENHPGESYNDIAARFMPFCDRVAELYRQTEANVLLISHGQTLGTMLPLLLSNVDKAYSMDRPFDGSFYATAELRDGKWVCLRWGQEMMIE